MFLCKYSMAWYPFDTQHCTMDITLNIVQVNTTRNTQGELGSGDSGVGRGHPIKKEKEDEVEV